MTLKLLGFFSYTFATSFQEKIGFKPIIAKMKLCLEYESCDRTLKHSINRPIRHSPYYFYAKKSKNKEYN